jgi:hypothetical protein
VKWARGAAGLNAVTGPAEPPEGKVVAEIRYQAEADAFRVDCRDALGLSITEAPRERVSELLGKLADQLREGEGF